MVVILKLDAVLLSTHRRVSGFTTPFSTRISITAEITSNQYLNHKGS